MKITKTNENYCGLVIKLPHKQPIHGFDNLVKVEVFGNDVLVSKDSDEDASYIFFPAGSKLNSTFLSNNNLFRDGTQNQDQTKTGFFENSGRVKALKLKNTISTGFIIPTTSVNYLGINTLKIGDEFNEINGVEIVSKYIPVSQTKAERNQSKQRNSKLDRFDRLVPNQFRFHSSTSHFAKNTHIFENPNSIIVITRKLHGTSAVFANVLTNRKRKWWEKLLSKLIDKYLITKEYANIYSSRSVVKNQYSSEIIPSYYSEDIWGVVNRELEGKIEEGISIYGEIVGYLSNGKGIQGKYSYGCKPKEHAFYVYRITYTKPNGQVIEFSWDQIKSYCKKYELTHVPEFYHGTMEKWLDHTIEKFSSTFLEKKCLDCEDPSLPDEGIVIRLDGQPSYESYKFKSKSFMLNESKDLDKGVSSIEDEN